MSTTVIGQPSGTIHTPRTPVSVSMKRLWSDSWRMAPEYAMVSALVTSGNKDLGTAEISRRYGEVKPAHTTAYRAQPERNLTDYWVRGTVATPFGPTDIFVGRVSGEARDVYDQPDGDSGKQKWVAHEPLQLLRKIHVGKAWHRVPDGEEFLEFATEWLPPMNGRDNRGMLVGNRSDAKSDAGEYTTYLYGGQGLWTARQYVHYILERFVEDRDDEGELTGPTWVLGGQASILDGITATVSFRQGQTVADILRRLIPPSLGLDWTIIPDETGFEIRVYALNARESSFAGASLPLNPNKVRVRVTTTNKIHARVVRSHEHRYGLIRVVGRRIVCAVTLESQTVATARDEEASETLEPVWPLNLLVDYKSGKGAKPNDEGQTGATELDAARRQDRYRTLFRAFAAPVEWDHQDGAAAPLLDASGALLNVSTGAYQNAVRSTLNFLPIRDGMDYTTGVEVDYNASGVVPDFIPPAVWLYDESAKRYVLADEVGVGVSVSKTDLGILLHASPAHLMALGRWSGAAETSTDPLYNYDKMCATVAFETDTRLALEVAIEGASPSDGVLEIVEESAELWYLAPHTVFGTDSAGELLRTPGGVNTVTRNDKDRLAFIMAGALARHYRDRARAVVSMPGIIPHSDLRGHIVTVIDRGGELQFIQSPVTSVEYRMGETETPRTTLRTGFA